MIRFAATLVATTMLLVSSLTQAAPSVDEIVAKANHAAFYQGKDGRAMSRMMIVDGNGRKQLRQFVMLRRDVEDNGDQQFMVLFVRPADVRRTVFRVEKNVGGDDDRWLYLPNLDLVKRISAGDKRTSFVGSHFYYEDVSGRNPDEDKHELVEETDQYYVLKNTPKDPGSVEFAHYTVWVDKNNFLPMRTEYTSPQGKVYRRVEAVEVEEIQGFPTVTKMQISDLNTGGYTLNQMRNIEYDIGIPESVFSERSLRNPPREWFEIQ